MKMNELDIWIRCWFMKFINLQEQRTELFIFLISTNRFIFTWNLLVYLQRYLQLIFEWRFIISKEWKQSILSLVQWEEEKNLASTAEIAHHKHPIQIHTHKLTQLIWRYMLTYEIDAKNNIFLFCKSRKIEKRQLNYYWIKSLTKKNTRNQSIFYWNF